MRVALRRARVVAWVTIIYMLGLIVLACYLGVGPLDVEHVRVGVAGVMAACVATPLIGSAWRRADRSA